MPKNYQTIPEKPYFDKDVYGNAMQNRVPVFSTIGRGPKGAAGEKGEKGDPLDFSDLTQEQIDQLVDGILSSASEVSDAVVNTTGSSTSEITIPFENFGIDYILFVDVNGLTLVPNVDYTISDNKIILDEPIMHEGTRVHFRMIHYEFVENNTNYQYILGLFGPSHDTGINYFSHENTLSDFYDLVMNVFGSNFSENYTVSDAVDSLSSAIESNFSEDYSASDSSSRPSNPVIGAMTFDTTLGKPIWWNGSAWVDATGTTV